jgi:hypothetical protein
VEDGRLIKVGADIRCKKYESGLLRPDGCAGFDTPSGKVEIASATLDRHGYDALPVYADPDEGPMTDSELHKI